MPDDNQDNPADASTINPEDIAADKTDPYEVGDPSEAVIPETNEQLIDEPVELSPELLERAALHDIDEDEAKAFGDAKSLEKTLNIMDRQVIAQSKIRREPEQTTITQPAKVEKLKIDFDSIEFGEDGRKAMNVLLEAVNEGREQNARLQDELKAVKDGVETSTQSVRAARIEMILDGAKEYESIIGPTHPRNRGKVMDQIAVLQAGYKSTGKPLPSDNQLVKAALAATFPNHVTKVATAKTDAARAKLNGQAISRPAHRNGKAPDPHDQVMADIRKKREEVLARSRFSDE